MPPRSTVKSVSITPSAGMVVKVRSDAARAGGPSKMFINIAYDAHIPRPPSASPDTVKAALGGIVAGDYAVPLIVSDVRAVRDKAGADSLVVDVVFSPDIESWMSDADFRRFIIELAMQKVEHRHSMVLDRNSLAYPNIRSKGTLESRTVMLPSSPSDRDPEMSKPLIEELEPSTNTKGKATKPVWRWTQDADSGALRIVVDVPKLTRDLHARTALDLEPRRLLLRMADIYDLDAPLDGLPRPVDVERARAEWRVGAGQLVISA
ncbi:pre-RNA processing PIH1/Nop17-domain-containing protein [Auriculariales sp. MPI-PUGE-AT-0066]|nr:pre-RNA processing PIH1/Nop17-domain-containing protein [Auriculariales sp. MPI-PUGE-AT-0066]